MALIVYTTYASVRAALGVSDEDIEDATLALDLYADYLTQELEDISLTLESTFISTSMLVSPSAEQTRFLTATRLFATFAVAKQLTAALPLFSAKQISDGKATVQRFDNPYRDTIKNVLEQYDRTRNRLISALAALGTSTTASVTKSYFSVVSPDTDPIVG